MNLFILIKRLKISTTQYSLKRTWHHFQLLYYNCKTVSCWFLYFELDITKVPVTFWRKNRKCLTPHRKSDCFMTSIVQVSQIPKKRKDIYTWHCIKLRHIDIFIFTTLHRLIVLRNNVPTVSEFWCMYQSNWSW